MADPVTAGLIATAVVGGASAYSSYRSERAQKKALKEQRQQIAEAEQEATAERTSLIQSQRKQLGSSGYSLRRTSSTGLVSSGLKGQTDDEVLG